MNSRIPLLSSYLVKDAHVRDQPIPGSHINFHGISQVGDYQLEGESEKGKVRRELWKVTQGNGD